MKLTPDELAELERTGIWRGRHKRRYPSQNGNSHDRRKIRRADWIAFEKQQQKPRAFLDEPDGSPVSIIGGVRRQRLEGDLGLPVIAPGNYERKAPHGKFRVSGVDTFAGPFEDYLIADCDSKETAIELAKEHGGIKHEADEEERNANSD